jgi:hypothetical protein
LQANHLAGARAAHTKHVVDGSPHVRPRFADVSLQQQTNLSATPFGSPIATPSASKSVDWLAAQQQQCMSGEETQLTKQHCKRHLQL